MTVADQVIAQAQQLAGRTDDAGEELLHLLCRAAVRTLSARLRENLTPEDCREDFVTAASLYALGQWYQGRAVEPLQEFKAGDLTVKAGTDGAGSPRCLMQQALLLLQPYCRPGFLFRGV